MGSTSGTICIEALRAPVGTTLALRPVGAESLRARAPKLLAIGETLDFRTLMPQPGGLFDYKVFGPGTVIDAPVGELDAPAKPSRTQFARLVLAAPLVHPLAIAHASARVAELVHWTADEVTATLAKDPRASRLAELATALEQTEDGRALVIRELPVLPPDLRPLLRLDDDRWQSSPINELYRHVVRRNHRLAKALETNVSPELLATELNGLGTSVQHLFENEDCAEPVRDVHGAMMGSLRGLVGGSDGLFAALAPLAPGAPPTNGSYRAASVLFALGFEPAT